MTTVPQEITPTAWFVIKTRLSTSDGPKVFLNVCTHELVPPAPKVSEERLQKIVVAENAGDLGDYFVPLIVSDVRHEKDKAGNPCLVSDCIVHTTVRTTSDRTADYRTLLIAISLDIADARHGWSLSREISLPNMQSKGKLKARVVNLPVADDGQPEVDTPLYTLETVRNEANGVSYLSVVISVPKLNKETHAKSALDIEPKQILLDCPNMYALSIALDDQGIDVNKAKARWVVAQQKLVVEAPVLAQSLA